MVKSNMRYKKKKKRNKTKPQKLVKNTLIYFALVTIGYWFFSFLIFWNNSGWQDLFLLVAVSNRTNCSHCWLGLKETLWVFFFLCPMKVVDRKENFFMKPGSNISTTHTLYGPALWTVGHVLYLLTLSWHISSLSENNHFWIAQTRSPITFFLADLLELDSLC